MNGDVEFAGPGSAGWVGQRIQSLLSESRLAHARLRSGGEAAREARRRLNAIAGLDPAPVADVSPDDEHEAWMIVQRRVLKLYHWRRRLAEKQSRAHLFELPAPSALIEEVACQLEIDQTIHCMALRFDSADPPAERLAGSIYTDARDCVFRCDAETVARFAEGVLGCEKIADEACCESVAHAALALAQHTARYPYCHGAFQEALKRLASRDPRLWLVDLRFEDFLANHRLIERGQILGTYTAVDSSGEVRFEPPLEDEDLTAQLRARFNMETADAFLAKQRPQARIKGRNGRLSITHAQRRSR